VALPIAGIFLSPLLHPEDVFPTAEVMLVSRLAGPAPLAGGFAGIPARGLGTELLMMAIARVGIEQLLAMQTLALWGLRHATSCDQGCQRRKPAIRAPNRGGEENGAGTREENFSANLFEPNGRKKTGRIKPKHLKKFKPLFASRNALGEPHLFDIE
jgi:hypothetical protein